jgi:hypothetical protein
MRVNLKYFQISSIEFTYNKFKYNNFAKLKFNNNFQDFEYAQEVFQHVKNN